MGRKNLILSLVAPFAIFFFLVCFMENWASAQPKPQPKMVVKKQSHDFREVLEGIVIEHPFTILNQGQETLLIQEVRPG